MRKGKMMMMGTKNMSCAAPKMMMAAWSQLSVPSCDVLAGVLRGCRGAMMNGKCLVVQFLYKEAFLGIVGTFNIAYAACYIYGRSFDVSA